MAPLEGITIIEFSTMITASLAAMMAAEQGARVIKIEPVETGDPMRGIGTSKAGMSGLFANCNRGKESVRLDLKDPRGQALAAQLSRDADVVIHNFRPGVMDGLGLGSDALRAANPRLIYVAITGFGTQGPLANAPAYDPVVQAHAGIAASQGRETPAFVRNLMCDKITAYTACQALTAALFQRERTDTGQHIDLSMLDSSLFFLFPDAFMNHTLLDEDAVFQPLLADLLYELTLTSDGAVTISASTPAQRMGVYRALGKEEMATDPRFSTLPELMKNMAEYRGLMAAAFAALDTETLLTRLADNDVPCARCLTKEEVLTDAQVAANGTLDETRHPHLGRIRRVRSPAKFGGDRLPAASDSPAHGEHTRRVLAAAGLESTEIDALTRAGVVA
ncbi:MAG: CoA transferase [Pseudomonadales bacterium]